MNLELTAPHYETPIFNTEGNSWINANGMITCDQTDNVCLYIQNFTLDDQVPAANSTRRGQPTITIGELVCFYNIVQNYLGAPPAAPVEDTPDGPFINLTTDGPTLALVVFGSGTPITVTATVGTIGTSGAPYSVSFNGGPAITGIPEGGTATFVVPNPGAPAQNIPVEATVTSSDGLTATANIDAVFNLFTFTDPPTIMGNTYGAVNWSVFGTVGTRTASGTFTTGGSGNWDASFSLLPGLQTDTATMTYTLTGPGLNLSNTLMLNDPALTDSDRDDFNYTNMVGTYNWTITLTSATPNARILSSANGSALFTRRFF